MIAADCRHYVGQNATKHELQKIQTIIRNKMLQTKISAKPCKFVSRSSLEEDQPSTSVPELGSTCSGEWSAIYLSAQQQKQLQRQHGIPHGLHCLPQSHGQCTNLPQRLMISWFRNRKHAAGSGPKATLWQAMTRFKIQQVYAKSARLIVIIWNSDNV